MAIAAPEALEIEVTQLDIDNGVKNSVCSCPIALAIKRCCNVEEATVRFYTATIKGVDYVLPAQASGFIARFDAGEWVTPFKETFCKSSFKGY